MYQTEIEKRQHSTYKSQAYVRPILNSCKNYISLTCFYRSHNKCYLFKCILPKIGLETLYYVE